MCDMQSVYSAVGRPAFLNVNLDTLSHNVTCLRQCARNPKIAILAMVKGNGYGHGAVPVSQHLKALGVERLGVATVLEGIELRLAGIKGPIHVFGNLQGWEAENCLKHGLIPTVGTEEAVEAMGRALNKWTSESPPDDGVRSMETKQCTVHIKVDSGMSRNGCQIKQLPSLIQLCKSESVTLEGIFTHLADCDNKEFTQQQMDTFYKAIMPYRGHGLMFHVANSECIIHDVGTELDIMRPGIALYGLPGGDFDRFTRLGCKPIASIHGQASMVKHLSHGRQVGYGCTYRCEGDEWVVTIPVGYADFYWRHLSNKGVVIRERTGERCPIVGRVSMDAITLKVSEKPDPEIGESFTLVTADFDQQTSVCGIADMMGTIPNEVMTRFQGRLPRYYNGDVLKVSSQ